MMHIHKFPLPVPLAEVARDLFCLSAELSSFRAHAIRTELCGHAGTVKAVGMHGEGTKG